MSSVPKSTVPTDESGYVSDSSIVTPMSEVKEKVSYQKSMSSSSSCSNLKECSGYTQSTPLTPNPLNPNQKRRFHELRFSPVTRHGGTSVLKQTQLFNTENQPESRVRSLHKVSSSPSLKETFDVSGNSSLDNTRNSDKCNSDICGLSRTEDSGLGLSSLGSTLANSDQTGHSKFTSSISTNSIVSSIKKKKKPSISAKPIKTTSSILHSLVSHAPSILIRMLHYLPDHDLLIFSHTCSSFYHLIKDSKKLRARIKRFLYHQHVAVEVIGKENLCRPFKSLHHNPVERAPLSEKNNRDGKNTDINSSHPLYCPRLKRYLSIEDSSVESELKRKGDITAHGPQKRPPQSISKQEVGESTRGADLCHNLRTSLQHAVGVLQSALSPRKQAKNSQAATKDKASAIDSTHQLFSSQKKEESSSDHFDSGQKKTRAILGDDDPSHFSKGKFRPFSKASKKKLSRL